MFILHVVDLRVKASNCFYTKLLSTLQAAITIGYFRINACVVTQFHDFFLLLLLLHFSFRTTDFTLLYLFYVLRVWWWLKSSVGLRGCRTATYLCTCGPQDRWRRSPECAMEVAPRMDASPHQGLCITVFVVERKFVQLCKHGTTDPSL